MANQVWNRLGQITSNYKNSQQAPSLNNNQYSSYYSKLYPGLNEESYNKMVNAVDSLGLTGENRTNAMNNYYRTHVKTLINDQTLQERDGIINQQAYEAAKLNNKDADAELRMTEAVQKAKKLWNLDATANDREVFSTMVETLGADGVKLAGQYLSGENDEFLYKTGLEQREVKKPIEVTGGDIWDNIRTKANVPIDTMKKWGQRTFDKMGALLYKNILQNKLGDAFQGKDMEDYVNIFSENIVEPRLQENALNYQQNINERYKNLEQKNLDQNIKGYYDNKGYTELLSEGDFKGFAYKSLGDAAQNREMPVVVAASVVQPEIGLALMATDTYARENQEAFENMLNNGATYEQAENGAVVVGLINSAVEVGLEKLIGGVETGASDAIRKTFMKNVQEEATKKGLGRILLEGAGTQLRASGEEGLEEIVQQIVQNAAVKTVNENQELFEGVGQAFEGGFYNPMNLLAGGGNLTQNISQNTDTINQQLGDTAYNAGVMTRNIVDGFTDAGSFMKDKATAIKQMAKERLNRKNGQNVTTENVGTESTAITPQGTETTVNETVTDMDNGAIELMDEGTITENNANTDLAETQGGSKFWEAVSGLEDNIKEKIKRNPYAIDESRELIKNMENNPGLDFSEYQNERYESVLDMIEEKLKQAEDKRKNDVGGLYTKLEEANAPIDTTNLKNRIAEYQARVEELGDILSSSDKAKIETILRNIQEIGDGTMDIWKVRKIADQWAKYDQGATGDGIRLIRDIRNAIDDEIMAQNPEMKEVDQAYKKAKDEIQDLRGNLTYKKTGEIKSNAVSTVKNMLNANNKKYLSTLEKYIPGITERLQAIRDSKLVYNAYTSGEGSRFVSKGRDFVTKGILAGGGYLLGGPVGAGVGYLISGKVDAAITSLARKGLKETITKETAESKAELERINKKIEENQRLEAEEKAKLKELGDRIMQKMATMDKTDAEQSAWNNWLADLEQDEVIDMPEEVYDQWEEVTTTPKKKTTKKKTSKKTAKLDTKNAITKKNAVKSTEMEQEGKYLDIQTNKWSDAAPEYVMEEPSRKKLFEGIKDKVESAAFSQENLDEKRVQADQYLLPNGTVIVMYKSSPTAFGKQYDYDIYTDKDGVLFIKENVDYFPENARVSGGVRPNIKQEMTVENIKEGGWIYDKWQEANGLKKGLDKNQASSKTATVENATVETEDGEVVSETEIETLPADVSVEKEATQLGEKRIAPDRILWQQITFDEGVDKVYDSIKTIGDYLTIRSKLYTSEGYNDGELNRKHNELQKEASKALYGKDKLGFISDRSAEFKELRKNISENKDNPAALKEIAKTFYISKVKKDISKGYQFPVAVLERIPGVQKALNARERYQKGVDTSFSAKDARIDYSEQDKIGGGIKSQDGKQVTKEQKDNIVKGILDFQDVFGIDVKKIAQDKGIVFVDLHGGNAFLRQASGLYREAMNEEGGDKNVSVSVGGSETIRWKDTQSKEWKTEKVNTTMSHELGHAMDYLVDKKLLDRSDYLDLYQKYKKPQNRRSGFAKYLERPTEVTARAFEEYMDVAKGGEKYYDKIGYWNKEDFEYIVKPILEEAIEKKLSEWRTKKS